MKKLITGVAACVATTMSLSVGVLSAGAVSTKKATVASAQDVRWMQGNARTDLAEITIGKLAMAKAQHTDTKMMAQVTIRDHKKVLAELTTMAEALHITLPSAPGTVQKAAAAKLMAIPASQFDKTYDNIQIAGHLESIAHTKIEIATGGDPLVTAFATYYLPLAQKHLKMARADLDALG